MLEKIEYPGADIQRLEFVESVLSRPRMYTRGGTFDEVIAFLGGYEDALIQLQSKAPDGGDWRGFREWYAFRTRGPGNNDLSLEPLREKFGSDAAALAEIRRLYREFRAEQGTADQTE